MATPACTDTTGGMGGLGDDRHDPIRRADVPCQSIVERPRLRSRGYDLRYPCTVRPDLRIVSPSPPCLP